MAKPKLAYIPATIGDKVYSILPSNGVGDFDFTRGTVATRINAQGLIEEVASGENRLNYSLLDGEVVGCPHLLLEPERTNLIPYSEDFSQLTTKSNITITDNQVISPDGSLNAASIIDNSVNGVHRAFTNYTSSVASGQVVSHSVFAKAKEHKWFQLSTGGNTNDQWANFDLENGVIGNSSSSANPIMEYYGNGWYRCILFATTSANNASLAGLITLTNNLDATLRSPSYSGSNGGVFIFGLQIEQGSFPTSYIKSNSGSPTTRAAELCYGSGNAATFNDSEGVLMFETQRISNGGHYSTISLDGGDLNNYIGILYRVNTNEVWLQVVIGSVQQFSKRLYNIKHDENNKFAVKYENTSFNWYLNGFLIATNTASGMPFSSNTLNNIGFIAANSSEPYYGKTKQVQYFDSALSDTELEQLTSWDSFRAMAEGQLYTIE